jgi:hypothetical protein
MARDVNPVNFMNNRFLYCTRFVFHPFAEDFAPSRLPLDRVIEGRQMTARDSRLPVEILSVIIRYIDVDKVALASRAPQLGLTLSLL